MKPTDYSADTGTGDQHRSLLDQLVGDPGAVDEYYAARQQSGSVDRDASTDTPRWAWS